MSMRLEKIEKIDRMQKKQSQIEDLLNDLEDYYFKSGSFTCRLVTEAFPSRKRYDGVPIEFDKIEFTRYLNWEHEALEKKITEIIQELAGGLE